MWPEPVRVDRVIRDLRNYIFGLRPSILRVEELDQALRKLADEFERADGVVAVVDVDPQAAAAVSEKSADVLQLAAEAISNVRRHARAQTVRISLRLEDGTAVLEVDDDGQGFDPRRVRSGQGLRNFRERAANLGGEATIESARGKGSTLRAAIPV
jgi:signal transduction histidine kinase